MTDADHDASASSLDAPAAHDAVLALAEQLAAAMSVREISHVVATTGVEALGASAGFVAVANADATGLEMHSHVRPELEEPPPLCSLSGSSDLPVIEAWRFGLAVYVHTAEELYARYPSMDRARTQREALASLPLEVDGARLGAINLTFATPQPFDAHQQAMLRALAGLCAQALRRAQLAADVERMRRDFVVTASHELRTPLSAIYGAAVTMSGTFPLSDDARGELTRLIVSQAERMRTVIDDLRVTSDLDADATLMLRIGALPVDQVLRDAVAPWTRPGHGGPAVRIDAGVGTPPVAADAQRLQQVLVALVDNACKYGPHDGTVRVSASLADPGRVRIDVVDEGPGLAPRDMERAFEQFFRADPFNRSGVAGTGLGLYIARKLATAMDGRLTLAAGPDGRGLRASVELPAWREA